jgi:sialidase-1
MFKLALLMLVFSPCVLAAEPVKTDLFTAGVDGYETYRIPGIVVTKKGTLLVYCEARKSAKSDWGHIDVMLRRSVDGGKTFDSPRKIVDPPPKPNQADTTVNNPTAITDGESGIVHFVYCFDYAHCFYMRSDDDGQSFSKPVDITSALEELRPQYSWRVFATGPGHGIRLKTGRLLIPVWLANGKSAQAHRPSCLSTIYSDDSGKTWHAGEIVATNSPETPNPNETTAVELNDGRVMLNIRNESKKYRRLISISKNGISGWSTPAFDEGLPETICMASLIRTAGGELLFSAPAGDGQTTGKMARKNLTLRVSADEGKTWRTQKLLDGGIAAYSDLAQAADGTIYCFYERGFVNAREGHTATLRLAKFKMGWLGEDGDSGK